MNFVIKKIFSKAKAAIFFAAAIFSFAAQAEIFSSSHYGWALDLPEGFFVSDAASDGLSYFLEHEFAKVRIAIKIFPKEQYQTNDLALEENLNRLNADGEIDGFLWRNRKSSVATYSFQIPGNKTAQSGWGVSVTLPKNGSHMIVLCYADKNIFDNVLQFIISCLDSLVIEEGDWRKPGILSCYAFNFKEEENVALQIGGKKIFTKIPREASEAGRFVIDREFSVLTLYAAKKNWKEAWQRYYRIIFREAYSHFDAASRDIFNALNFAEKNSSEKKTEIAKTLLAHLQNFSYARAQDKSDFNDLASVLQDKGSDCDSRALLLCVLMEHLGVKSELFVSAEYSHALCGLDLQGSGARISVDGVSYLLCETTAKVEMGLVAREHSETSKWISVDLP